MVVGVEVYIFLIIKLIESDITGGRYVKHKLWGGNKIKLAK